jgi:hypothetical protein
MSLDNEGNLEYTPEDFTPQGRKIMYEIFDNTRKNIDECDFLGKETQEILRKVDRESRARYERQYREYQDAKKEVYFNKNHLLGGRLDKFSAD